MASSVVLGFAFVLFVTHLDHTQKAGILFETIAAFTILENIAELGADTGMLRILPQYRVAGAVQDLRSLFVVSLVPPIVAATVAGGLLWAFAPEFARVFVHHGAPGEAVLLIRSVAPFLPFATLMTVAVAASRGLEAFVPYVAIQSIGVPLVRPLAVGAMAIVGIARIQDVALAWAAPLAFGCVASLFVVSRKAREELLATRPVLPAHHLMHIAARFWRFASPRGLAAVFQIMVIWLDILLVGAIESARQAAIYTVASRYVLMGALGLQALGVAFGPQLSRLLAQNERVEARSVFRFASWWVVIGSWPVYFTMAAFSPVFMRLFGHDYGSGATALTILSLGMLVLTGTGSNGIALLMAGRSSWSLAISAIALAVNLSLNLLLIPHLGIDGAAVAWAVTVVLNNGLTAVLVWRFVGLDPLGSGFLVALGVSAIFAASMFRSTVAVRPDRSRASSLALGVAVPVSMAVIWRSRRILKLDAFGGSWASVRLR